MRALFRAFLALIIAALGMAVLAGPTMASLPSGRVMIPTLREWTAGGGSFLLSTTSRILVNTSTQDTGVTFAADLAALTGLNLPVVTGGGAQAGDIRLTLGSTDTQLGSEGYRLTVGTFVQVDARAAAGAFYGTRSILQLVKQSRTIPAGSGRDWPAKSERGMMVDNGRKYFTVAWLRNHVKELAYLKLNYFHLHLSDNLGFRLESITHPEIVSAQHYTKQEISDLIALAAQYHVTIVPEIDMPGHMDPILAAHPELKIVNSSGSANNSFIDLSKPAAYTLMSDLINEYLPLFPGPYWHLGADEYVTDYSAYPQLLTYARAHHGANATAKDTYYGFINWANGLVRASGKTMRMWNDGIKPGDGTINPNGNIIVEYWYNIGLTAEQLVDRGHRIMNASWTPTYYVLYPGSGARPDMTYMYESWNTDIFNGGSSTGGTTITDPTRNSGAKLHIWCDVPSAETEAQVAAGIRDPLRGIAQQAWGTPKAVATYAEFKSHIATIGRSPGYPTAGLPGNLALNKPTTASTVETGNFPAVNATDGDAGTRWSSGYTDTEWLQVDLGATQPVRRVILRWENAYGRGYKIQTSNDAAAWTTIHTATTGDGGVDDINGLTGSGRYVRMQGITRATSFGFSLFEMEVYPMVAQAGPNPIVITPGTGTDDLTVLPAAAAERDPSITVFTNGDIAKNYHVQTFTSASAYLAWTVSVPAAAPYRFWALLNTAAGQQFTIGLRGTTTSLSFTKTGSIAQRIDAGTLSLPAGTSTIELRRTGALSGDVQVKSLEMLRNSDYAAYQGRIANARAAADLSWLRQARYGLMFQYGSWGFPGNAGAAKSLEQQAKDFNVPRFVATVKETGAAYVIWSFSWWGYRPDMPSNAVDAIMNNGGASTAQRDLIGEVAAALHAQGIRFALYYHEGKEEASWWQKQNFPSTFPSTGTGDRSTFLTNWKNVVSEIGTRLGTNLDGFFFDDGMVYYPAPFEALEAAARTGNPARVVSWNNWIYPRLTEFQDVWFGEGNTGQAVPPGAPVGGNGILTAGPNQGLLEHGMFTMENDWGVHTQGQQITTKSSMTGNFAITAVTAAAARSVPLSFNLMMYEDGTMSERSLAVLNDLRQAIRGTPPSVPTGTTIVNDNGPGTSYSSGWSRSTGRGAGDYGDDVSYTTTNGSYVEYTFTGTGIDVIAPKTSNGATGTVTVDGTVIGTFTQTATSYTPQQVVYSARHLTPGTHTIRLTKTSGTYWQIDAWRTVPNPVTHNDTGSIITYQGTWTHAAGRGAGDHNDDVTWTATNGNSAAITFTGTGLQIRGPMSRPWFVHVPRHIGLDSVESHGS